MVNRWIAYRSRWCESD